MLDNLFERSPEARAPHDVRTEYAFFCQNVVQLFDEVLIPKADAAEIAQQATKSLVHAEMPDYQAPRWTNPDTEEAVEAVKAKLADYAFDYRTTPPAAEPVVHLAERRQEEEDRLARLEAANAALEQALKPAA